VPVAEKMGALIIVGLIRGIGGRCEAADERRWMIEGLRHCAGKAADRGVSIAMEPLNRYETTLINTVAEGLSVIEETGANNLGLLLDTFHMNIEEPSIHRSIETCGDRIFHFHVADSNRWYPGAGHLDFSTILKTLLDTGYSGFVSGEFMPDPEASVSASRAIAHLRGLQIGD
jgi:sugar phosphate isomerase/epimerase